jgi:putative membrane protein
MVTQQRGAELSWHAGSDALAAALELAGPFVLAAVVMVAVGRATWLRRRYRAVGMLAEADVEALHEAVRRAERSTVGEVVPVVVERSDPHAAAAWRAAALFLLAGSALLYGVLPWHAPGLLLSCQAALGAAAYALARALPDFERWFVTAAHATAAAEEQALQEFFRLRLHETAGRTGVLLFVSLFERRVVVLADQGIDRAVESADPWVRAKEAVLRGVRAGSLRDGLVTAVDAVGVVLAAHAPTREGDRNEVPDRVVVRRS